MSFFTEVISKSPLFTKPGRVADLSLLEPVTRQMVQAIIDDAAALGIQVMAFETFRSKERQKALFDQGASKLKDVGVHHYGLACDIVKVVGGDPSWKGSFDFLRDLARKHGLIWGGDWGSPGVPHSFVDAVHVQRCTIARQASLFRGEWYPDAAYNPYADSGVLTHAAGR